MAVITLSPSPSPGSYTHQAVREKINEIIGQSNNNESNITPIQASVSALLAKDADSVVIVKSPSDLSGALDSTKVYVIDGFIDMGSTPITVPAGGLDIRGYGSSISRLYSSQLAFTLFVSQVGGCGTFKYESISISTDGVGSSVFALEALTGFESIECRDVIFLDCASLGYFDGFRQGLEMSTFRSGGKPELELRGEWLGGYRQDTALIRGVDPSMTGSIFKAGAGLELNSRFVSNVNADLSTSASFTDFSPSNFNGDSLMRIEGAEITRNGVSNAGDTTITPNITANDTVSLWSNNKGVPETHAGGLNQVTTEAANPIATQGVYEDVLGTFTSSAMVHFTSTSTSQMTHISSDPRDFTVMLDAVVDGTAGEQISIKIIMWDDSASTFNDVKVTTREILQLQGASDVAYFNMFAPVTLDDNDYVKLQIANNSSGASVTVKDGSALYVTAR